MINPKIEKVKADIVKTKAIIAEYQKKLRDLERQKTDLENLEIIALYRRENFGEDDFSALAALLRSQRDEGTKNTPLQEIKEEEPDEFDEN